MAEDTGYFLKDDPNELLEALNMLLAIKKPFAIATCRSGLAIDICEGDGSYLDKQNVKRISYTYQNGGCLGKAIKEAIKDTKKR